MMLPAYARAATLELTGQQAALRLYLHGPSTLARWADLDAQFAPLVLRRLPAREEPWGVIVQVIRADRPAPLDLFGTLIWREEGAIVRSVDGRPWRA